MAWTRICDHSWKRGPSGKNDLARPRPRLTGRRPSKRRVDERAGKTQKELDITANEILAEADEWRGKPAAMVSREMDGPLGIAVVYPHGNFPLLFDFLDGSSNVDVDVSIGTVFSAALPAHDSRAREEAGLLQAATN